MPEVGLSPSIVIGRQLQVISLVGLGFLLFLDYK